ncbi:chloride channel protein [Gloeocapsa sp. PCC 73106]|uniref:chloride channel protein n=1 Tax=Gloeocapsa sp. PCC 73106 TaxID=102232 RepID=UPI0002ACB0BC|nr:chloride channel protein [Gloeocapsa sp. PCC 73106]ELR99849.1 chloride channel protein EriC [Gloeocapsa sp. PCC 73106]
MPFAWNRKNLTKILLSRTLFRSSFGTAYNLFEAALIGVFSAFAALLLKQGIGWLGGYRLAAVEAWGAIWALPLIGLLSGLIAGWLIDNMSPEAAGGGVPQVKAALSGFPIALSLKVALVKGISTILVLSSSLVLGRRAPTVHIGAALAAQWSDWMPTTPEHRRQMIAAGAAAGLAAGFNTPIAGVLFVVEELMRDASNLTLETAILASFVGSVVSRRLTEGSEFTQAVANLHPPIDFTASEIFSYVLLGLLAGILGGLFNRFFYAALTVNKRSPLSRTWRMGLVGMISGLVITFLPSLFYDKEGLLQFLMTTEGDFSLTGSAFVAYFFLSALGASTGAPGGLFAPALIMGASLGDIVGTAKMTLLGNGSEYIYTLTGMGAFFTSVVRVPVTATIIVFEMTGDFELVLPLMIACAVAYFAAETVSKGSVYGHLLESMGIPIQEQANDPYFLKGLTAFSIMQSKVEALSSDLTLGEASVIMSRSHHRGFPVLELEKIVGIFTQGDLRRLNNPPSEIILKEVMTSPPITVTPDAPLSNVLYLLDEYKFSRLPVTERGKLVGIITRTDIINAEAKWISGKAPLINRQKNAYTIYQTRSFQRSKGRILLPLSNPQTAPSLFKIATAIASYYEYEIECIEIIRIPKHNSPQQTQVNPIQSRSLMQRAEKWGRRSKIPVHTRVCIATDIAEAMLEVIAEGNIKLVLAGWKGNTSTPGAIFGDLADVLIDQVACDLVMVKLGQYPYSYPNDFKNGGTWLIPYAGGPNSSKALELLPSLAYLYPKSADPTILLSQVSAANQPNFSDLEKGKNSLRAESDLNVTTIALVSNSTAQAIINLAEEKRPQLVMLGASGTGLLQQAINGNVTETIAHSVKTTVILVRSAMDL